MRFIINDNNIKIFLRYGFRIFLMITLLSFILLFSQRVVSQEGTNLAGCNEHTTTRFSQPIYTDPNLNYSGAIIVYPSIIDPNILFDPNRFESPYDANYVYTIDPNLKDPYEPDDDPKQANRIVISEFSNQFHTFHNKHDIDWVYLYGTEGESYSFNPESANEECLVLMTLYDANGEIKIWSHFDPNMAQYFENSTYYNWYCPQSGFYTLRLEPIFLSDLESLPFSYAIQIRISIHSYFVLSANLSGSLYGHVVNEEGEGVNGILISLQTNHLGMIIEKNDITRSLGYTDLEQSMKKGWYSIINIQPGSYYVIVTDGNDTNNTLVSPFKYSVYKRDIKRIPDIQISDAQISLPEDLPDEIPPITGPYVGYVDPEDPNGNKPPPFIPETLYEFWAWEYKRDRRLNEGGDEDEDGFTNFEEFINGTNPLSGYAIQYKSTLNIGLNLFPYYIIEERRMADNFIYEYDCQSIRYYDNPNEVWRYYDINSGGKNFDMEYGKGYISYKQINKEPSDLRNIIIQPVWKISLNQGLNISPVPLNPQGLPLSSYEFIMDKGRTEGVKSISCYRNCQKYKEKNKGAWESAYIFFGRPAGRNFSLLYEDAYVIGVKQ